MTATTATTTATNVSGGKIAIDELKIDGLFTVKGIAIAWNVTDQNVEIQADLFTKLLAGRLGQILDKVVGRALDSVDADTKRADRLADVEIAAQQARAAAEGAREEYYRGKNELN